MDHLFILCSILCKNQKILLQHDSGSALPQPATKQMKTSLIRTTQWNIQCVAPDFIVPSIVPAVCARQSNKPDQNCELSVWHACLLMLRPLRSVVYGIQTNFEFMARHWAQHQVLESFASHSRSLVYWFSSLTQRNGKTCSENLFFCFKILSHRFLDFYSPNANTRWRVVAYGNTGESFSFVVHPSKHLNIIIHSSLQITRSKKRENK